MTLFLVKDGYGLDRALGALFWHAKAGETVSVMAARSAAAGRPWGCRMCRFLSWAVEPDHCTKALATGDTPTARPAAYRAGAWLLLYGLLACAVPWVLVWLVGRVV